MSARRSRVGWALAAAALVLVGGMAGRRLLRRGGGAAGPASPPGVAVHTGAIVRATLRRYVTAYGQVVPQPAERGRAPAGMSIGSQVSGVLVGIDCAEGQRVAKGEVLFRLDSRVAEVAVAKARSDLEFAEKTYARQKELLPAEGTSRKAYLEAERQRDLARSDLDAAETHLALLRIAAPLSGTVVHIEARLGQSVDAATTLATIVDYHRLVVSARVPSAEAALLRPGQEVRIGEGSPAVAATLSFVGRDVDPGTDTVEVRAGVPDTAGLLPGRFLPIRIVAEVLRDRLAVPEDSLVTRAGEGTWIVRVEGDEAVRRPVTEGLHDGGLVEIEGEGLAAGQAIVTDDAYSLPPKAVIRDLGR